ncbi:MAG: cysteine--tRNA ligase [Opitutales bacterium]|nr:cysteine--tRNA ligase [Opitutales bacterium]
MKLFNTLSREISELTPLDGNQFRMYVCGPTVYGPAHIGNFITFTRADILYRTLKVAGLNPYYVRNITDVDDKTIRSSQEQGMTLSAFTEKWTTKFHEDCALLNLLIPDVEPRATEHIPEQIDIVQKLMDKGHAYQGADGSVYYRVKSFCCYGKLSHFDPEELRTQDTNSAGRANDADEYERDNVADFALWKARKPEDGDNYWESPWGQGRPGWHLECSAMSIKYLGETFDLHAGGEDLCFPHHENEIAQSEAATGKEFCRHWMHSTHLMVEGKKMSKSLGNFFVLQDLLDKGYSAMAIRMAFLNGHYRQQLNFTFNGLDAATSALGKLAEMLEKILPEGKELSDYRGGIVSDFGSLSNAWMALSNDLNTPAALGAMFSALKKLAKTKPQVEALEVDLKAIAALTYALGLEVEVASLRKQQEAKPVVEVPADIAALAEKRSEAKKAKDWGTADALRQELQEKGWKIIDTREGYSVEPC